jgi:uncharacterized membrane protein
MNILSTVIFCLLYAIVNVAGAAMIKFSLKGKQLIRFSDWLQFLLSFRVLFAFVLIFVSALIMFKALSKGNFSFVVPVATGFNFMLTILVSFILFREKFTITSFVGFLLIITGIFLLSLTKQPHAN